MKLTRSQLRKMIIEAVEDITDPTHKYAVHDIDPETKKYFDFIDAEQAVDYMWLPDSLEAMAKARQQGLDPNKMVSIARTYQGRDERGGMKYDGGHRDHGQGFGGYNKYKAASEEAWRAGTGRNRALGKLGR